MPRIAKGGIMVLLRQLPCRVTQTLNIIESSHSVQMMIMIIHLYFPIKKASIGETAPVKRIFGM